MTKIDPLMIVLNANHYESFHAEGHQIKRGPCPNNREASKKFAELVELVASAFDEVRNKKIPVDEKCVRGAFDHVNKLYTQLRDSHQSMAQMLADTTKVKVGDASKIKMAMEKLTAAYLRFQKRS